MLYENPSPFEKNTNCFTKCQHEYSLVRQIWVDIRRTTIAWLDEVFQRQLAKAIVWLDSIGVVESVCLGASTTRLNGEFLKSNSLTISSLVGKESLIFLQNEATLLAFSQKWGVFIRYS